MDNCEHLIDACAALVDRVLTSCPHVKVLATSREALNVSGGWSWRLRSLTVPSTEDADLDTATATESVHLFAERAQRAAPGFEVGEENLRPVVSICRQLDGVALAIELAAARLRTMTATDIASRLDDRFRLLTGGARTALPRQQTLEATVAWRYDLLASADQLLFDRLTVFAGGFSLEAAERVCADDVLPAAGPSGSRDRAHRMDRDDEALPLCEGGLAEARTTGNRRAEARAMLALAWLSVRAARSDRDESDSHD